MHKKPHWNIGLIEAAPFEFLMGKKSPQIKWLPELTTGFRADPFGCISGEKNFIFYEYYSYRSQKGVINLLEMREDFTIAEERTILETENHLSFPFVFNVNETTYLLPESYKSGGIDLYEFQPFPASLKRVKRLVNAPGVDPVLYRHENLWWLFYSDHGHGSSSNLRILFTDDLLGKWHEHPKNPAKTGLSSSRNAGMIFQRNGHIFRVAQDCVRTYGAAVTLCQIQELTTDTFEETDIKKIEPLGSSFQNYPDGLHHVSAFGNNTLIDGNRLSNDTLF